MLLDGILAISGQQGLFKLVSKGKSNVIVESILTGKKIPAFSTSRISPLEDVAIYTESEDKPIEEIFITIFEKYGGNKVLQEKTSNAEYEKFLEEIVPDFDKDKVYTSDIKKLINWFNTLIEFNIINEDSIKKAKEENQNKKDSEEK